MEFSIWDEAPAGDKSAETKDWNWRRTTKPFFTCAAGAGGAMAKVAFDGAGESYAQISGESRVKIWDVTSGAASHE